MLNFSLSSLFQRHFCHSGNNSGHTHVVRVPSAGKWKAGKMSPVGVASTAGFCLGSFHARLPPIHGHIRTQCLRMEWTMDTPRPQTREHKNLWQMCTKKTWFGLEDDTCQSGMLTALAARAGRLLSRDTSNSLESPQHLQNTINATISFLPSMLSFKVKCIHQFLLQLSVNFHHCYFIKYTRTPRSCFKIF